MAANQLMCSHVVARVYFLYTSVTVKLAHLRVVRFIQVKCLFCLDPGLFGHLTTYACLLVGMTFNFWKWSWSKILPVLQENILALNLTINWSITQSLSMLMEVKCSAWVLGLVPCRGRQHESDNKWMWFSSHVWMNHAEIFILVMKYWTIYSVANVL